MAGAIKHMERSHRSHSKSNRTVFVQFHNKARVAKVRKDQRKMMENKRAGVKGLGAKLASLVKGGK